MLNREKVTHAAKVTVHALEGMQFNANEYLAFMKCLDHVFRTRCVENDLVVTTKSMIEKYRDGKVGADAFKGDA